jgi:hypothetical protein
MGKSDTEPEPDNIPPPLRDANVKVGLARWLVRTGYPITSIEDFAATSGIAQSRLGQLISGAKPNDAEISTLANILQVDSKLAETDMVIYYTGEWGMADVLAGEDE